MKKIISLGMSLAMIFAFAACGSQSAAPAQSADTGDAGKAETETVQKVDFDGSGYSEMGAGDFAIQTPSGSSEDGSVPFIFADSDTYMDSFGYTGFDADGSHLTYIYVDGMEQAKEQIADFQSSIDLTGDLLKEGVHKVEFVQYDTDDPSGNVIMYKTASYEIKSK